jgi:carboxyl-terminal processing protease
LRVDSRATLTQDVTLTAGLGGASLELTGIGASIKQTGSGVVVASVFAGDPAEHAGLRAGDLILSVDGESTDGMSSADVIQRLRGQQGASVGVTAQRPATGETVDVLIERGIIVH